MLKCANAPEIMRKLRSLAIGRSLSLSEINLEMKIFVILSALSRMGKLVVSMLIESQSTEQALNEISRVLKFKKKVISTFF
jgi:hypothetical protein